MPGRGKVLNTRDEDRRRSFLRCVARSGLFVFALVAALGVGAAFAKDTNDRLYKEFYSFSGPDSVLSLLTYLETLDLQKTKNQNIPVGLLAALFAKYPDKADEWVNLIDNRFLKAAATRALWVAGLQDLARARLASDGWTEKGVKWLERHPVGIASVQPVTASRLNVLWGVFYATGDVEVLRRMTDQMSKSVGDYDVRPSDIFEFAANINSDTPRNRESVDSYLARGKDHARAFILSVRTLWSLAANSVENARVSKWLTETFPAPWNDGVARIVSRLHFFYKNHRSFFTVKRAGLEIAFFVTSDNGDIKRAISKEARLGETRIFPKGSEIHLGIVVQNTGSAGYGIQAVFDHPDGRRFATDKLEVEPGEAQAAHARNFSSGSGFVDAEGVYKVTLIVAPENVANFNVPLPILVQSLD